MDPTVYALLVLLHVLGISTWFGAVMLVSGDVKRTLEKGAPHTELLPTRVNKALSAALGAGALAIASGFALIFAKGGFGAVPHRIHTGLLLAFILFGLHAVGLRGTWKRIEEQLASPKGLDAARGLAKRFAMLTGIGHLLWLLTLITMVLPIGD